MVMTGMYIVLKMLKYRKHYPRREIGNQAITKLSSKIEKHEKIAMLAVSSLNTISSLISKALSYDSILDGDIN